MLYPITRRSQLPLAGLGAGAASGFLRSVGDVASKQIQGVTFRSTISPDINLTGGEATGDQPRPSRFSELFLQFTKPTVYVDTSLGTLRIAPWGEPQINLFPVVVVGTVVGLAVIAGLVVRGLRK